MSIESKESTAVKTKTAKRPSYVQVMCTFAFQNLQMERFPLEIHRMQHNSSTRISRCCAFVFTLFDRKLFAMGILTVSQTLSCEDRNSI